MNSSLGFHTLSLSLPLMSQDIQPLIRDFKTYSQNTGLIQIFHKGMRGKFSEYTPSHSFEYILPTNLEVRYHKKDRGITWNIRESCCGTDHSSYMVEAKINPKILGGIIDYITAATYGDMNVAIHNFNQEAKRISPLLKNFECYKINRIDYCINFDIGELTDGCSPELVMNLIRRGDIPQHYKEWTVYDDIAHRKKSKPGSFYLINSSANVNCYSKYMQLQDRSHKNLLSGFPPIPQATLDAAKNIIRFEVQYKYHKMYTLSKTVEKSGNHSFNKYKDLLTPDACSNAVNSYFDRVVGKGDWHTLPDAVRIVKSCNYNCQKEKRLIDALYLVSQCRSIPKAKEACQESGQELETFKRTLKELSGLGINPVTIPKGWGCKHIPNLMHAYQYKLTQEKIRQWDLKEVVYNT